MRHHLLAIASLFLVGAALPALAQTTTTQPVDANRDGKVTGRERADTNRDGTLTQQEKDQARKKYEDRFRAADKNNDGGLSRTEARAGGFDGIEKNFTAMDANRDGKVTLEERRAHAKTEQDRKAAQTQSGTPQSQTSSSSSGGGLLPPR
jgi:hypothetical protein